MILRGDVDDMVDQDREGEKSIPRYFNSVINWIREHELHWGERDMVKWIVYKK